MAKRRISYQPVNVKKKKDVWGWILVSTALLVIVWMFWSNIAALLTKRYGERVQATVIGFARDCSGRRGNTSMKVAVGEQTKWLQISQDDCKAGKYKIGQKIAVLRLRSLGTIQWPHNEPAMGLLAMIVLVVFVFFMLRAQYRSYLAGKRKEEEKRLYHERKRQLKKSARRGNGSQSVDNQS
ncbi:MAG TPA: hypothetical protein VD993_11735 [Chitinophagaceae bacterium]|nr:hypothetical protein [Chitinophagaceae bacterium]